MIANWQIPVAGKPEAILQTPRRKRFADIDFVVLKRACIQRERSFPQHLREGWWLVRVGREDSEKPGVSTVPQQILECRLDIHSGGYGELASCGRDPAGGYAEMFEQGLAQAGLSEGCAADRKGKSHAAS